MKMGKLREYDEWGWGRGQKKGAGSKVGWTEIALCDIRRDIYREYLGTLWIENRRVIPETTGIKARMRSRREREKYRRKKRLAGDILIF